MQQNKSVKKFKIEHLDPMGQGVSKIDDKITFIAKTLPGEEGDCEVFNTKKGVEFATLISFKKTSKQRIESECPHFKDCPSCHYLHTSYQEELLHKENSIQKELRKIKINEPIVIVSADHRFNYRNRVQFHYDLDEEKMGYLDVKNNQILEVPHCLLPQEEIQKKVKALYKDKFKDFPKRNPRGHIEIYINAKTNLVETAFNKPYAHAGFTQVNAPMNQKALGLIENLLTSLVDDTKVVLDLFGGQGNLSQKFANEKTFVVDKYHPKYIPQDDIQKFLNLNLFEDNSSRTISKKIGGECDIMIIDPPRSGFKNIKAYTDLLKPKSIIYMSCKTSTMARDLQSIEEEYQVEQGFLIDFFPGTFHYESLIFATLK